MDKGVVYTNNGILLRHPHTMPFVTKWMDLEGITVGEISLAETNTKLSVAYVENK